MNDGGVSLNKDCPCQNKQCPILGNCVICVQNHLKGRHHIPECFQDMLRPGIETLAKLTELRTSDARPNASQNSA